MKAKFLRCGVYALLLSLASCKSCKKEVNPDPLPPETQTGANTFGCLIDGQPWIPNGGGGFSGIKPTSISVYANQFLLLTADVSKSDLRETISICITDYTTIGEKILKFDTPVFPNAIGITPKNYGGYIKYYPSPTGAIDYITTSNIGGKVIVTKADIKQGGIYAGTFEFDAVDKKTGQVIKITNGRFDIKFSE